MEVGVGGACDRAMGRAAMKRSLRAIALLPALAGCKALPDVAGAIGGGVAGGASGNPAVGLAVGIAIDAVAEYAFNYVGRTRQQAEQDAIAAVAGNLPRDQAAVWRIRHDIPIGNEHGELRVVREIKSPLAACKEIVFSVNDGSSRAWYTAAVCQQAHGWKWASAEPAVERWGALQ